MARQCRRFQASRLLAAAAALMLAACVAEPPGARQPTALGPAVPPQAAAAARKIGILLPLTGPNAEVGQAMLKAAQLALADPGSPELVQQDTAGTPEGAANAARAALAAGVGLMLGPLTAAETAAAGPLARGAGVPMLAFTSDGSQAQPGVWPIGVTLAQQARRLVLAVQAENKLRVAAVLPANIFGDALASGITGATAAASMPPPRIVRTPNTFAAINDALKEVGDFNGRRGAIEGQQRAARARNDAEGRREAAEIGRRTPPPPPMDALFLGVTGELLSQVVPVLSFYDIGPDQLRILGPATWAREAARLPDLAGAWYAAPDPARRAAFEQQYTAKYNTPARDFTSLAFDAASIARGVAGSDGFSPASLTRAQGFAGADGLILLAPDGQVRRGLAIFQVERGSTRMVQPAPQTSAAPGV